MKNYLLNIKYLFLSMLVVLGNNHIFSESEIIKSKKFNTIEQLEHQISVLEDRQHEHLCEGFIGKPFSISWRALFAIVFFHSAKNSFNKCSHYIDVGVQVENSWLCAILNVKENVMKQLAKDNVKELIFCIISGLISYKSFKSMFKHILSWPREFSNYYKLQLQIKKLKKELAKCEKYRIKI